MQSTVADKTLAPLNGLPCSATVSAPSWPAAASTASPSSTATPRTKAELEAALRQIDLQGTPLDWVIGGDERQSSVYNALRIQAKTCTHVFIHDSARPLVSAKSIQALHTAVLRDRAAVLAHPVADTIKRIPTTGQLTQIHARRSRPLSPLGNGDTASLRPTRYPQSLPARA